MTEQTNRLESAAAPFVVALIAICFGVGAWNLRGDAGQFPLLVSGITASLAVAETFSRLLAVKVYGVQPSVSTQTKLRSALLLAWFACSLAGLYLLGVVVATAAFSSVYLRLFAGWRWPASVAVGIAQATFFWVAFKLLAGFRLHEGILLERLL